MLEKLEASAFITLVPLSNISSIAILLGITALILWYKTRNPTIKRHGKPLRYAPDTIPLLGNTLVFLRERHELFSWFVECTRLFGFETFAISVPILPSGVVINDPKNLEYVLQNIDLFAKGSFFKRRSWDLFGYGFINADGELWKIQRRAGLKFLNKANMKVLTDLALPKYLNQAVEALAVSENSIVDMDEVFHEVTTQLMGKLAYNMEIHHADGFSMAFDYASGVTENRFKNPLWKITEFFTDAQFKKATTEIMAFGVTIVSNVMQQRKSMSGNNLKSDDEFGSTSGTLINSLIDEISDEKVVAEAALSYLSAGKDTTSQVLTWTLYLLMKNPEQMMTARESVERLASEYKQSKGENSVVDTSIFQPSALPYIEAVCYESLRLYPPVPIEIKECQQSTFLPDGTYLTKGSIVIWSSWAINRSHLIWGEDADLFKPERWIENGSFKPKTSFEFPVFNGGPRKCVGKTMAENIAVQVIATMIYRFNFNLLDNNERISKNSLTLPMRDGLPCRIRNRK